MAWQIQLKLETGGALSQGSMVNLQSGTIKLRMRENNVFLVPVKYTLFVACPHWMYLATLI